MIKKIVVLALAFVFSLAAFNIQPVFAATGDPVTVTGVILSIDEVNSNFQVETTEGVVYTIHPALGFDYSTIEVGDEVTLNGVETEVGNLALTDITVITEQTGKQQGFFCIQSIVQHPAALKLSQRFGVEYSIIQSMFFNGAGIGQIMLAFETAQKTGGTPEALLAQRVEGKGWGQIWHGLGLKGNPHGNLPELSTDTLLNTHGNGNHGKPEKSGHGKR